MTPEQRLNAANETNGLWVRCLDNLESPLFPHFWSDADLRVISFRASKSQTSVIGHPRSPDARDRGTLSRTICPMRSWPPPKDAEATTSTSSSTHDC